MARSRRRSPRIAQRHAPVLARIQALKADHPLWGYRRTWAELPFAEELAVNTKRILRLMREQGLVVQGPPTEGAADADAEQASPDGTASGVGP